MAVRANQKVALELIKSRLKGKPHVFESGRILLSIISIVQGNAMKIIMVIKIKITSFRRPMFQPEIDARSVIGRR